jgi:hypothetical protein
MKCVKSEPTLCLCIILYIIRRKMRPMCKYYPYVRSISGYKQMFENEEKWRDEHTIFKISYWFNLLQGVVDYNTKISYCSIL